MKLLSESAKKAILDLYRESTLALLERSGRAKPALLMQEQSVVKLLSIASLLSLSDSDDERSLAYEIVSRLLEATPSNTSTLSAADVILSRIGNFPGRALLRERFTNGIEPRASLSLSLERISRQVENAISESALLTDFQYKLYNSLKDDLSLSISAPTSAGKSFVLSLDLRRRLSLPTEKCIVYIVPTRALVAEVSTRVRNSLREDELKDVVVRSAPIPPENHLGKTVFVLTQERFLSLLKPDNNIPTITSIFVDEAHEISKGKRGIVLQNAIEVALSRYPEAGIYFASPLISNPGYFLSIFSRTQNGRFFTENVSPVSQNVILVSSIRGRPQKGDFQLLTPLGPVDVGQIELGFKFRPPLNALRSAFAAHINAESDSTIIFSNGPADAEGVALELKRLVGEAAPPSREIVDLIKFVQEELHEEHPLAKTLPSGVAFHYGALPSIVRSSIEQLFRSGAIRFLCSTSTLLQGVNLPAKHIVIESPKTGDRTMSRADFRNLAGRAGRLLQEFQGCVWCLNPDKWSDPVYDGEMLQEVCASADAVMRDGGSLVQRLIDAEPLLESERELAEASLGRLYHESLSLSFDELLDKYRSVDNESSLVETLAKLNRIKVTVPPSLIEAHRALRPDHLQKLFDRLYHDIDLDGLILTSPFERGGKLRMEKALQIICDCFEWELSESQRRWYVNLGHKWITGVPVGKMIRERVEWIREHHPTERVASTIRRLLSVIEKQVRFELVKYFSAFEDTLRLALAERGCSQDEVFIAPYHVYLEFGSCNKTELNLMALGFSRFTALRLSALNVLANDADLEEVARTLRRSKFSSMNLPLVCMREISDILSIEP